ESRFGITARWMDQASLLSETPCAVPHAGCCGGWGLDTPGYPMRMAMDILRKILTIRRCSLH
ncbi:hypothetical protein JNO04_02325, partial [Halomonas sp. MC140]